MKNIVLAAVATACLGFPSPQAKATLLPTQCGQEIFSPHFPGPNDVFSRVATCLTSEEILSAK